jgi:signal transduction histidine kinase
MSFSYKNRIAFNYILSTALLISVVFYVIFQITCYSVNKHVNEDMFIEVEKHLQEIKIDRNCTYLIQVEKWRAREHNTVKVNPVFVQFLDFNDKLIDKSPNLKGLQLQLLSENFDNAFVDTYLNKTPIRQIQVPIYDEKRKVGHLFVAMSLDDITMILDNLRSTLLVTFPLIMIVLFFIARLIAGKSIAPVSLIIKTASQITKDSLKDRIALPQKKDELYVLSKTINDLLDRIENAVEREKQFTSDASHELRTPLTVLKGTLEVLIRKPRSQSEYEDKINYSINEVDRLNKLVDQLLLLARFENKNQKFKSENTYLNAIIMDALALHSRKISEKKITINHAFTTDFLVVSDNDLVAIIISNLISNAIKYSRNQGVITIELLKTPAKTILSITDNGIGIVAEDLDKISNPFYRSNPTNHPEIKGTGLGLSIVQRISLLLALDFELKSIEKLGTSVVISFPNKVEE